MLVNLPLLIVCVFLLWFPRKWMRRGVAFLHRRRHEVDPWNHTETGDPRLSFRTEFSKFRNYVDLFRAGAGSLVLMGKTGLPPALQSAPEAGRAGANTVLLLQSAVFLVGILIQTARVEKRRVTFYPAIFYLGGVSIGLCDVRGAAFAFILAWAINPALPEARSFLTAYAVLIVAFGHMFTRRGDLAVTIAGILTFLPVLLSLLFKRSLAVLVRKPKGGRAAV
jgi:hypothetical protein